MVDYSTGLIYGRFMMPLRGLLRKRRSEAVFVHEDYLYCGGGSRGKLKVEVRAIRKMKTKVRLTPVDGSPLQTPQIPQSQKNQLP